jgi:YggT family protein
MHVLNARTLFIWAIGALQGLLLARLVLRLFAARPDNPVVALLFSTTEVLRAPLVFLDAGQPQFGAVLELSTLVLLLVLPALVVTYGRLSRSPR